MHGVAFLQDLAVVMIVAGLVTILFHRLKQPVVLGYIIAGVIIGPHTPPYQLIHDRDTINTLAELGVVFLMFSLGLEFRLKKLKQVGATAFIAAALGIPLMFWAGYEAGLLFGWGRMNALFLGAMLSISSTTIVVKALGDLGRRKEPFAQIIFGILIMQDIAAIVMIALLSGVALSGTPEAGAVAGTVARLGVFLAVTLVAGLLTVPPLLGYVAKFKSNEMLLVAVLGLCFGMSLVAVKLGYSTALGAFVIGAIIAESREIGRIEDLMEPVRDLFCAVFFVAIGLLIDPVVIVKYWAPVLVITLVVIVGQVLACSFGAFVAGHDRRTSLRVGMGLAQIGEFSFIIASLGAAQKVTGDFLYPIAVAVSAITALTTPYLLRSTEGVLGWFDRKVPAGIGTWMDVYTRWVGELAARHASPSAGKFIRKWVWQIALNLMLVAGVFVAAIFIHEQRPPWLESVPVPHQWTDACLWAGAMLASMPMLIASYRKLQALAMIIGEAAVHHLERGPGRNSAKNLVSASVSIAGTVVFAVLLLLLSAAILPSWEILVVLGALITVITGLLWRSFVRIYSKAQVQLRATLDQPTVLMERRHPVLTGLMEKARVVPLAISPGSRAAGRLIRELNLRNETAVSIVGIERAGQITVNPGPDDELLAGDQVLLLGQPQHLDKAREFFGRGPEAI